MVVLPKTHTVSLGKALGAMSFANTFHETPLHPTTVQCTNCGRTGHTFRQCAEPVSSYGVLVFRWIGQSATWTPSKEFCKDTRNATGLINIQPQILMIQRKDSLGFMDIMRGKYKLSDPAYIRKQLRGMTERERERLLNDDFDQIWHDLWGGDSECSHRYAHDRQNSKIKLTELRAGVTMPTGEVYTLADLLRQEPALYSTPEWGFPKGRRDPGESDIQCAYRELREETGIDEGELLKVVNVSPLLETFYGSNDVHYRHTYYLAQFVGARDIVYDALNTDMVREIGDVAWKSIEEAMDVLRPENVEKRAILLQLASILRNYVPIFREPLVGRAEPTIENTSGEQQGHYVYTAPDGATSLSRRSEQPSKSRRFFGERSSFRRISNLRNGAERRDSPSSPTDTGSRGSEARQRGRGNAVSGYRR